MRWEPSSGSLAKDQESQLSLVFENCEPKNNTVTLPRVNGLTFGTPGISTASSFTFGTGQGNTRRMTTTLNYPVRPSGESTITIPAFSVDTDQGKLTVPAATFSIGAATVGRSSVKLGDVANSRFVVPEKSIWAGEVFPLTYSLALSDRFSPRLAGSPEWASAPLLAEDWPKQPAVSNELRNGENFLIAGYTVRAVANQAGTVDLPAITQSVALATGRNVFGLDYRQFSITTEPAQLVVKPLPQPAPADFTGAVGQFTLTAKAVPEKVAAGEPITWTLELQGEGNWPAITTLPAREVSRDFRVVQPRAQKTVAPGKLFDATLAEDVILIPTHPGRYTLGPVSLSVFNPRTGAYETLQAPAVTVDVTPAVNGMASPPTSSATGTATTTPPAPTAPPPAPPAAIPRDPLPSSPPGATPLTGKSLLPWALLAGGWPLALWGILAYRRARQTDPLRPRRVARQRLAQTLRALQTNPATPPAHLLLAWQHDTALLWNIDTAAPAARQIPNPRWAALWQETDRVLYRRDTVLSQNWHAEAQAALAATPLPGFSPLRLFLPKNLLPFLTLFLVASLFSTPALQAEKIIPQKTSPAQAYAQADFKTAEAGWREQLAHKPTDWSVRHNLSLTLAQQDRWAESAAQAIAAFVQHPENDTVRWQFRLALGKAGYTPAPLTPFLNEGPQGDIARLASPADWQRHLLTGVFLTALGAALALICTYRLLGKWLLIPAGAVILIGASAVACALFSLKIYGPLANENAAVVWRATTLYSVPTEVDAKQQTTPLAAGSVVLLGKDYLGWRQVSFPNGQTGWVRMEHLTPLWR